MGRVAVVVGSANTVIRDLISYSGPMDGIFACNAAGLLFPNLTCWVSIHSEKFYSGPSWVDCRRQQGFVDPEYLAMPSFSKDKADIQVLKADICFPGVEKSMTSGFFAAKVALVDFGYDEVVLCGIPFTPTPHFNIEADWESALKYQDKLQFIPQEYRARIKSMSGFTAEFFGCPEKIIRPS